MCGGDLVVNEGATVAECEYCGSMQTVPTADNEKKLNLYARANRLRFACEFDKAAGVYESIVTEFPTEAEAYWGLVLCRYGIEYVDDPKTGKKIPTCHRSSFESVMDDENLDLACENADAVARKLYRQEAKAIEELRKGIIEISGKEEPYDIFICYKESDENGNRTIDSVIAQDVYDALTERGYRVFFSRISLEDKLGQEYEPYIFAALHSAKIMLAFGTDYEYYNAVWVKNEWSRFLSLIESGEKKVLIPCYKGIDAYDMPKEFARLQAQDMGKVGAVQDLLRGIEKIINKKQETQTVTQTVIKQTAQSYEPLLKRAYMFLEDKSFDEADEYFEKVLDLNPECAEAYLGKLLVKLRLCKKEELARLDKEFLNEDLCKKVFRFGDDELKAELTKYNTHVRERLYDNALMLMDNQNMNDYEKAEKILVGLGDFKNCRQKLIECRELMKKEKAYSEALVNLKTLGKTASVDVLNELYGLQGRFKKLGDYKITEGLALCEEKIEQCKESLYKKAIKLNEKGNEQAIQLYKVLGDYKDVTQRLADAPTQIQMIKAENKRTAKKNRKESIITTFAFLLLIAAIIGIGLIINKHL